MKSIPVTFNDFDELMLPHTYKWLHDPDIKLLTQTPDFTKQDQLKWFNGLSQNSSYKAFGVSFEDKLVGVCGMKNITNNDAEYFGYIGEKSHWGKGIGQAMLVYIEELARTKGLQSIYLRVWVNNDRAKKLYLQKGYEISRNDDEFCFMKKELHQ